MRKLRTLWSTPWRAYDLTFTVVYLVVAYSLSVTVYCGLVTPPLWVIPVWDVAGLGVAAIAGSWAAARVRRAIVAQEAAEFEAVSAAIIERIEKIRAARKSVD